jgi:pimeloyl-ACP methyl ester carboxylesterase
MDTGTGLPWCAEPARARATARSRVRIAAARPLVAIAAVVLCAAASVPRAWSADAAGVPKTAPSAPAATPAVPAGPALTWHTVTAPDGVPLIVIEGGTPDAPPLLLLHGYSQSSLSWLPQFSDPGLARAFRLIAVDLRGHGASGKPWAPEAYAGSKPWAEDLHAVVTQLRLRRPVIVGWSFGGYVAMDYLRERGPEALAGVVLVASPGGLVPRPPVRPPPQPDDLRAVLGGARQFMALMSATPLPRDIVDLGAATVMTLPPYARRAMLGKRLDNVDLVGRLDGVPVLAILGAADPSVPGDALARVLAAHGGRVVFYEGVGHSPFAEASARFGADLAEFATVAFARATAAPTPPPVTEVPVPAAVHEYITGLNAGDAARSLAAFAPDAAMYLVGGRVARGPEELGAIERFHAVVRPHVSPEGFSAREHGDRTVVAMRTNVETSPMFEAMGLPTVRTESVGDAFVVRDGRIITARQPEFAPACRRVMGAAMGEVRAWMESREDSRLGMLMPGGVPRMDADTAPTWLGALRDWRAASGWEPARADRDACAAGGPQD